MFLGVEWYWWLAIAAALAVSVPFKMKWIKGWSKRRQAQRKNQRGKWGDVDD